jgi:peptidoglycan/LPS O-acetylase OafA/YrhL
MGINLAIAFLKKSPSASRFGTAIEVGSVVAVVTAIGVMPQVPQSLRYAIFLMPFWGIVILTFARQQGVLSRALSHPWMIRLGEASFAFYMIHYVVLSAETRMVGWSNVAISLAIGLAITIAMSFALFHWIETPLRRLIRGGRDLRVPG